VGKIWANGGHVYIIYNTLFHPIAPSVSPLNIKLRQLQPAALRLLQLWTARERLRLPGRLVSPASSSAGPAILVVRASAHSVCLFIRGKSAGRTGIFQFAQWMGCYLSPVATYPYEEPGSVRPPTRRTQWYPGGYIPTTKRAWICPRSPLNARKKIFYRLNKHTWWWWWWWWGFF
jgi:hypothetical protein